MYHDCLPWCLNTYGSGQTDPDPTYLAKHAIMMDRYGPLPDGWKEQYDPGTGRHYYWCTRTDRVSWLPPGHPKAQITDAASQVREMLQSQYSRVDQDEDEEDQAMDLDSDMDSEEEDREIEERRRREKEQRREEQDRYRSRDRDRRDRGRGGSSREDRVDPMDPASYSDAPRYGCFSKISRIFFIILVFSRGHGIKTSDTDST